MRAPCRMTTTTIMTNKQTAKQTDGVRCQRCGKEWQYKGKRRFFATCPDCRHNVKLNINRRMKPLHRVCRRGVVLDDDVDRRRSQDPQTKVGGQDQ
jgi:hypothetical protein